MLFEKTELEELSEEVKILKTLLIEDLANPIVLKDSIDLLMKNSSSLRSKELKKTVGVLYDIMSSQIIDDKKFKNSILKISLKHIEHMEVIIDKQMELTDGNNKFFRKIFKSFLKNMTFSRYIILALTASILMYVLSIVDPNILNELLNFFKRNFKYLIMTI